MRDPGLERDERDLETEERVKTDGRVLEAGGSDLGTGERVPETVDRHDLNR